MERLFLKRKEVKMSADNKLRIIDSSLAQTILHLQKANAGMERSDLISIIEDAQADLESTHILVSYLVEREKIK